MDGKPHGRALRKGRTSLPHHAYLITTVTQNRQAFFRDLWAGRVVVQTLKDQERHAYARTLAYVVMPDHLHWLMQLGERADLSAVMGWTKAASTRRLRTHCVQYLDFAWQRGFHDRAVRHHEDLVRLARYVVSNPLRAGLVSRIGDYSLWDAIWLSP